MDRIEEDQMIDTSHIIGHGADADPSKRPGIPRETEPRMAPGAIEPERQQSYVRVLQDRANDTMPPVYGTAQPPKALSGAMRKLAYGYPAHWTRHWMLLLVADRVDVMEHRARSVRGVASIAGLIVAGGLAATMLRRRATSRARRARALESYEGYLSPT
ncbi:MAG: hypothetical protein M3Y87_03985 [Myxococcota bacterium]|nr:hypothetical protein [Myxococcota bacterium]